MIDQDKDITNKVLEALSLNVQESSMAKEIAALDTQIQLITAEREKLEKARNSVQSASESTRRSAQLAREMTLAAEKAAKEAKMFADKAMEASKEASAFSAIVSRPVDYATPIGEATKAMNQVQMARKEMNTRLAQVRMRREELKKEGVNINLDGTTRVPRTTVM